MSESVLAASDFSLETSWKQAEKGTLSHFECLSFANTMQVDLPTCALIVYLNTGRLREYKFLHITSPILVKI